MPGTLFDDEPGDLLVGLAIVVALEPDVTREVSEGSTPILDREVQDPCLHGPYHSGTHISIRGAFKSLHQLGFIWV